MTPRDASGGRTTWPKTLSSAGLAGGLLVLLLVWRSPGQQQVVVPLPERASEPTSAPSLATAALPERPTDAKPPSEARVDAAVPAPTEALPPNAYAIEGTVRDVSGAPVGDVVIQAHAGPSWTGSPRQDFKVKDGESFRADVGPDGRFRVVVTGTPRPPNIASFAVEGERWQVVRLQVGDLPAERWVVADPGGAVRVTIWVRRSYRLRGVVTSAAGEPVKGAVIAYEILTRVGSGSMQIGSIRTSTGDDGRFDVGPFPEDPRAGFEDLGGRPARATSDSITFQAPGNAIARLDPSSVPPDERDRVVMRLHPGYALEGVALDPADRPVAGAVVVVEYGEDWRLRRGARTDAEGRWKLEGLTPGPLTLTARAFAQDLKVRRELVLEADDREVRLVLEPIRLSTTPATTEVLGLRLAEVDDEMRAAYDVPKDVHVLILDPGALPESLGIGRLEKGYGLWMVGPKPVRSVREAVDALLDRTESEGSSGARRRVVYTFWNEQMSGTNTQHVHVTPEQETDLRAVRERLSR